MESFLAGAASGLVVDLSLYPIDTIKTRIQSKEGFRASGGFSRIYKGLGAVAIGSIPGGALFFYTYDTVKDRLMKLCSQGAQTIPTGNECGTACVALCQIGAAMTGETAACCVRVPVEMVKQRMQVGHHASCVTALRCIIDGGTKLTDKSRVCGQSFPKRPLSLHGLRLLFTGMPITLMREWPFSVIQMSMYEYFRRRLRAESAPSVYASLLLPAAGAVSGGVAAFLTTPLDVIKTRVMLQRRSEQRSVRLLDVVRDIAKEEPRVGDRFGAPQKFFRGASARVLWISLGGGIFFGTYELVRGSLRSVLN